MPAIQKVFVIFFSSCFISLSVLADGTDLIQQDEISYRSSLFKILPTIDPHEPD